MHLCTVHFSITQKGAHIQLESIKISNGKQASTDACSPVYMIQQSNTTTSRRVSNNLNYFIL